MKNFESYPKRSAGNEVTNQEIAEDIAKFLGPQEFGPENPVDFIQVGIVKAAKGEETGVWRYDDGDLTTLGEWHVDGPNIDITIPNG